jgi:hypothetical protein
VWEELSGHLLRAAERVDALGVRFLGAWWPGRYLGAPFGDALAYHPAEGIEGLIFGHARAFDRAMRRGEDSSAYFRRSGITKTAAANGGVCSFRMGKRLAIYQITNRTLTTDDNLAPSLDTNRELFGDFMGALPNSDPRRKKKRLAVETTLGNGRFIDSIEDSVRTLARQFLAGAVERPMSVADFALFLVAHVDSHVPGVVDLRQKDLPAFLASPEHGRVARDLFQIASDMIANVDPNAAREFAGIRSLIRELLLSNFESIASAASTNLILRQFALWDLPFTRAEIERLDESKLKELGTIIIALYDTTALSVLWAIDYIESDEPLKKRVMRAAKDGQSPNQLSFLDRVVLEAVRLGGSNPTALWRRPLYVSLRGARGSRAGGGHVVARPIPRK